MPCLLRAGRLAASTPTGVVSEWSVQSMGMSAQRAPPSALCGCAQLVCSVHAMSSSSSEDSEMRWR